MNFDKSSSAIVLDVAWAEVDEKNQGFIYAKNFPALIRSIESILSKGQGKELQLTFLSNTGIDVIDTFAREKEFFKIYKDEFKEIFQGLVGKSFKEAVDGTLISKSSIIKSIQKSEIEEENEAQNTFETPRKMQHKIKNLENRLTTINEELRFKDGIIAEKDREVIKLARGLGEYKDKYEFLQRQFSFYKDHGEAPKHGDGATGIRQEKIPESELKNSTKHDFIISELRRKLQEQTVIIATLRDQIQTKGVMIHTKSMTSASKINVARFFDHLSTPNLIFVLVLLAITFSSIVCLWLRSLLQSNDSPLYSQVEVSWWEKNNILSRIGWFFKDWTEPVIDQGSRDGGTGPLGAYDQIFGLKNSDL